MNRCWGFNIIRFIILFRHFWVNRSWKYSLTIIIRSFTHLNKVIFVDFRIRKENVFIMFDEIICFPIFEAFDTLEDRVLSRNYCFFPIR